MGGISTFVLFSARRKLIGRMLVRTVVDTARKLGYEKLIADLRKMNRAGLKFYERCGFSKVAELKNQVRVGNMYDDVILMEKFI